MSAKRYRSKPSEVEAIQWTGDNQQEIADFLPDGAYEFRGDHRYGWDLYLLAGKDGAQKMVPVPVRHWLLRQPGDLTDHWPNDPDYFAAKYEPLPARPERQPAVLPDGRHTAWCGCDGRGIVPGPTGGSAVKCPAKYEVVAP